VVSSVVELGVMLVLVGEGVGLLHVEESLLCWELPRYFGDDSGSAAGKLHLGDADRFSSLLRLRSMRGRLIAG
jgi:hypothetical protein